MSQNRARIDLGGNDVRRAGPGDMAMDQKHLYALATVGAGNIPPEAILAGIINRTGPTAGYIDTWPSADSILAACPVLTRGDSFEFLFINGVAFANTSAAGAGITLVNGSVTASLIKRFMATVLADGRTNILQGVVDGTTAVISLQGIGMSPSQAARAAQQLRPGMLVTGTGIPASSYIIGVNSVNGNITINANTTTPGTVALTFTPNIEIRGLYQAAA